MKTEVEVAIIGAVICKARIPTTLVYHVYLIFCDTEITADNHSEGFHYFLYLTT